MDGDGRDDLLAGSAEDAILVFYRGTPHGLLSPADFSTLTVTEAIPMRIYPPSEGELILLGRDREGRRALVRISADEGPPRSSQPIPLPEPAHGVRLSLEDIGGQLVEGEDGFWLDRTNSEAVGRLPARTVLGLGDLDGDGRADAVAQVGTRIMALISSGGTLTIGTPTPGDLWLVGDLAELGADQVIRLDSRGKATIITYMPFGGAFSLDLSLVPDRAIIMGLDAEEATRLVVLSGQGEAVVVSLVDH